MRDLFNRAPSFVLVCCVNIGIAAGNTGALAQIAEQRQVPGAAVALTTPAELTAAYAAVTERRRLQGKAADFQRTFPATDAGRALAMVATLVPYGLRPYNANESAIMGMRLGFLSQHATDTFAALNQGLSKVAPQYYAERQWLIQFASRLTLPQRQILNLLGNELRRAAPVPTAGLPNAAFLSSATALDAIIRLAKDPQAIEAILVPALRAKTDVREMQALLARYHVVFPDRAEKLIDQFRLRTARPVAMSQVGSAGPSCGQQTKIS